MDWIAKLTVGEVVTAVLAIIAAVAVAAKAWRPIRRIARSLEQIASDWNGSAERLDAAGKLVEPARPGVMAQLETLRAQVQNSHATNLRDDVDAVGQAVNRLSEKFAEHVEIAKQSDTAQADLAERFALFEPKLEDLLARHGHTPYDTGGTS